MLKRQQYIAISVVLLLVLVVLSLPTHTTTQLKLALSGFFLPLFGLASSAQGLKDSTSGHLLPRRVLLERIEQLSQENEKLRFDLGQISQLWHENEQLRQALNWQRAAPWNLRLARVVLRDPASWWRMLHVDLGSRDGMATNMAVMTPDGLVGRVHQVGYSTSQVVLIGDPHCRVSAMVERTRDDGIIEAGAGNVLDGSVVPLTYLDRQSQARPGDRVVTSGLGGVFPKGIPVGQIIETNQVGFGLYLEAKVRLSANIRSLEQVWVLLP